MFVHFTVESETVRVYLDGDENSFANREKYDSIASIKFVGTTAHIYAAHGEFPISAYRAILNHCVRRGMCKVIWEHRKQDRVIEI